MSAALKPALAVLLDGGILTRAESAAAMGVIMDGAATDAQIGGFLAALRLRGERPAELLGFLDAFRERARAVRIDDPDAVDLCGTGGDGAGTINVSTLASFFFPTRVPTPGSTTSTPSARCTSSSSRASGCWC